MNRLWRMIVGRFGDDPDEIDEIAIDGATNAMKGITTPHAEIHEGSFYMVKGFYDLPNAAVADLRITVPNTTKWPHTVPLFETEGEVEYYIYEGAVISSAGTPVTPRNRNRNFNDGDPDQSGVVFDFAYAASLANANINTKVTGATILYSGLTGSGKQVGGGSRDQDEIEFGQDTIYNLRLIANAAGWANWLVNYYEHTNKHG